jgi:hypothetical protein
MLAASLAMMLLTANLNREVVVLVPLAFLSQPKWCMWPFALLAQ